MATEHDQPFRVAVSIPSGDMVKMNFAYDLANMIAATAVARADVSIRLHNVKGSILPKSREDLALMALEHDYTHILYLDADHRFPRNTLLRLLARNEFVVAANYATRAVPVKPVTFRDDADPTLRVYTEEGQTGLEEVASVGFGCVLIDLDVFRAMSRPWFLIEWDAEKRNFIGEDVFWCRKARKELGAKVFVDHDLSQEVRHIGEFEYSLEHARDVRDSALKPAGPLIVSA